MRYSKSRLIRSPGYLDIIFMSQLTFSQTEAAMLQPQITGEKFKSLGYRIKQG